MAAKKRVTTLNKDDQGLYVEQRYEEGGLTRPGLDEAASLFKASCPCGGNPAHHRVMEMRPTCHPKHRFDVAYVDGVVLLRCSHCFRVNARILVADHAREAVH